MIISRIIISVIIILYMLLLVLCYWAWRSQMVVVAVFDSGVIPGTQGADVVVAHVHGDAPVEGCAGLGVSVKPQAWAAESCAGNMKDGEDY